MAGYDNAVDAGEIGRDPRDAQTVPRQNCRYGRGLPEADLGGEEAVGRQQPGQLGGDRAVRGQPIGAAVERPDRIVLPYLGRQDGDRGSLDVGGVGDHGVEPAGQRRRPASDDKMRPRADAEPLGIVTRGPGGARRDIDPDTARLPGTRTSSASSKQPVPVPRSRKR